MRMRGGSYDTINAPRTAETPGSPGATPKTNLTFRQGILAARSHLVMIAALLVGFGIIYLLDPLAHPDGAGSSNRSDQTDRLMASGDTLALAARTPLRPDQIGWAKIAWGYFEHNIDPATGLCNSVNAYPSTTMWDVGSFLLGMISAEKIGILDRALFDSLLSKALASLAVLPLFDGALPNKAYNTHTLAMVDYTNKNSDRGIGWSALDVARALIPLTIIKREYPAHSVEVDHITSRWVLSKAVSGGLLTGSGVAPDGRTELHQEGRVGYEQYGAKALILMGFDAYQSFRTDRTIEFVTVDGVQVPVDARSADKFAAQNYATTEPYMLDGIELGFDQRSQVFSQQIYKAQVARFDQTKILTAVSEGQLDKAPFFAYATVYGNGVPWAVLTDTGARVDAMRILSTKTAFSLDALYGTPYTTKLMAVAVRLNDPSSGWLEGRYEADNKADAVATANTNGIILEGLHYRAMGPLLRNAGK